MSIKRWSLEHTGEMKPTYAGYYVTYEDHKDIVDSYQQLIETMRLHTLKTTKPIKPERDILQGEH